MSVSHIGRFIFSVVCAAAAVLPLGACQQSHNVQKDTRDVQSMDTAQTAAPEETPVDPYALDDSAHNLRLTIISPEEETFKARQARMYNALAEGNAKYAHLVNCHWDFYLNENNQETLYQTMDNSGVLSGESKEMCGFTSTFIDRVGTLRVVLTMTIYDAINPNLETVTAERSYTVL